MDALSLMDVGPFIQYQSKEGLASLLACTHGNTRVVEGKTFCPDCGIGVVFRWTVVRCGGCNQRRQGRYWLRQIVPQERCCTYCGEHDYKLEELDSPSFYQLRHAMLAIETEDERVHPLQNISVKLYKLLARWGGQKG